MVAYVSSAAALSTSMALSAHQAGDLIIMFARRTSSNSLPGLPAGWVPLGSRGGSSNSHYLAYKYAASAFESSGTWTSANHLICHVYRNAAPGSSTHADGGSTNPQYPALTLSYPGASWVARFCGLRTGGGDNQRNVPSGFTTRSEVTNASQALAWGYDTNGPSGNVSATMQTVTFSTGWTTATLELIDTTPSAVNTGTFFTVL